MILGTDRLLYLFLVGSYPSFGLRIANASVLRDHLIDDKLTLILLIQVRIYGPWTGPVLATVNQSNVNQITFRYLTDGPDI